MSGLFSSLSGMFTGSTSSAKAAATSAAKAATTALSSKTSALQAAVAAAAKNPSSSTLQAAVKAAQKEVTSAKAAATSSSSALSMLSGLTSSAPTPTSSANPLSNLVGAVSDLGNTLTATTPTVSTPRSTGISTSMKVVIGVAIVLVVWVALGLNSILPPFLFPKAWRLPWYKPNTAAVLSSATASAPPLIKEGFQAVTPQAMTPAETKFVNLQPLCIKDTGFQGPYPSGVYDVSTMTANALKSGFRCLTLQIDYMEVSKDGFEAPNQPTLIVRDAAGSLLSKNSGSITDVCKIIAEMGFNRIVPNNTYPIVLYLHINRAPSPITAPEKYLQFLSGIARQLQPIAPLHLGLTPVGNFTRQKQEQTLLTTPIQVLEGQVIIMSNADTSLFSAASSKVTNYTPAEDLDFWVNMRVYLDSEDDKFGITKLPAKSVNPSAVIVDLKRVLNMSAAKKENFAANGMKRYVIAMGDRITNPAPADIDTALNTLAINCVPIDIFSDTHANVMALTTEYANMTYHPKPTVFRNVA